MRLLITGSRDWDDKATIAYEILNHTLNRDNVVLVHGDCETGADAIADEFWKWLGHEPEAHPADWLRHGKAAGPRRNREMVALGADLCLAFRKNKSRGTTNTIELCQKAGIKTVVFEQIHARCVASHLLAQTSSRASSASQSKSLGREKK